MGRILNMTKRENRIWLEELITIYKIETRKTNFPGGEI